MQTHSTIGSRIKALRQASNLSQTELAIKLNCTPEILSLYECGVKEPNLKTLIDIASALNTTTDYLLGASPVTRNDVDIQKIGNYLGFTDDTIRVLHERYLSYVIPTRDEELRNFIHTATGAVPGDNDYEANYAYYRQMYTLELEDYTKLINTFLCSPEFDSFTKSLLVNLDYEQRIFDLFKIITKKYGEIKSPLDSPDMGLNAYQIAGNPDYSLSRHTENLEDAQDAIHRFCRNFSALEELKHLEEIECFYTKLVDMVVQCTKPFILRGEKLSANAYAQIIDCVLAPYLPKVSMILNSQKQ